MRRFLIFMLLVGVLPFGAHAQLVKLMSKYQEKKGVTVTHLDKSLYALYQRDNLPPEATELLQNLDEVNILNLALPHPDKELSSKLVEEFQAILDNPDKYKLIKSRNEEYRKQSIYTQTKNGKVVDLVVLNQNPMQLDIIELKGDIHLDKIAMLSGILNINGLNSLAALSANPGPYESFKRDRTFDRAALAEHMRQMAERVRKEFGAHPDMAPGEFFGIRRDTTAQQTPPFGEDPWSDFFSSPDMPDLFGDFFGEEGWTSDQFEEFFKQGNGVQHNMQKFFQSFGDGENIMSNSVQITEENGKTKIKIDSKNSDMTYIIDGKQAPKDNVQMPENIMNVNIIPSKEDIKKSYLFIISKDKLGEFSSFKDGVLTFKYENQEYKYNLDKVQEPLLVIDGRLSGSFDIDPASILQIRPISQIEKEVGYYPHAEVIINTKY